MINLLGSGLVYRNPKPHLRSIHAWHPSLVALGGESLLASFDLGQGPESMDYRTYLSRSEDGGQSWSQPRPLFIDHTQPSTHTVRISRAGNGDLVAMGARFHRPYSEEGLFNRVNHGLTAMDLICLTSTDEGQTWSKPRIIKSPLPEGTGFEVCHSIIELRDGRWLWPTSTLKNWEGHAPAGQKAVALVSRDRGQSWDEYIDVMQSDDGTVYWEQSLTEVGDGKLLAMCWAFHEPSGKSLPNMFALSHDRQTFGASQPAGLTGETAKILPLEDDKVLCLYRHRDKPGLWAALAEIQDKQLNILEDVPLWQGAGSNMTGVGTNSDNLSSLKFGYPNLLRLSKNEVFAAFWCNEDGIYNIRWIKCQLSLP